MTEQEGHIPGDELGEGAEQYQNLESNQLKAEHMASKMDAMMTLALNAEKKGNTDLAAKLRSKAENKGDEAGREYDAALKEVFHKLERNADEIVALSDKESGQVCLDYKFLSDVNGRNGVEEKDRFDFGGKEKALYEDVYISNLLSMLGVNRDDIKVGGEGDDYRWKINTRFGLLTDKEGTQNDYADGPRVDSLYLAKKAAE